MGIKRLDELTAGMTLASDLMASDGRLLFKAGCELEDRHIALLKRVGVDEIDVAAGAGDLSEEQLHAIEEYVRDFFLYVDPDFEPAIEVALALATEPLEKVLDLGRGPAPSASPCCACSRSPPRSSSTGKPRSHWCAISRRHAGSPIG